MEFVVITNPEERFWSRVNKTDYCWEWMGAHTYFGYGRFKVSGKLISTHRFSWILHNGEIPDGMWVLHHCDNPKCVNPEHLFLGTRSDNMKDAYSKGRLACLLPSSTITSFKDGNIPSNRVITEDVAKEIKWILRNRGRLSLQFISEILGVKLSLIKDISVGRSYIHI